MRTISVPEYMAGFHCIGPECEANCCNNDWIIVIDKSTYQKYMELGDGVYPLPMKTCFKLNTENQSDNYYAELVKESDGKCPFHTKDGFCEIQQTYGAEYLSGTCNTYPRALNVINNVLEMSGQVSCPEIARRLLLNPRPIRFTQIEYTSNAQFIYRAFNFDSLKEEWQSYTLNLRDLALEILQDRNALLTDRLIFLGLFFQKAQSLVGQHNTTEIPRLISQFRALLKNGETKGFGQGINKNLLLQYELLKEICTMKTMETPKYRDFFAKVLEGAGGNRGISGDSLWQYEKILNEYFIKYYEDHEYIFENYLVNHVFGNVFPFSDDADMFNSYATLIIQLALIQFHLAGMAGLEKGMNEGLAVATFMEVSRVFEHDNAFLPKIHHLLAEKGLLALAHLIGLFKIK